MIHLLTPTKPVDMDKVSSGDTIRASGFFKAKKPTPIVMKSGVTIEGPATFENYYPSFDNCSWVRFFKLTFVNSGLFQAANANSVVLFGCVLQSLNPANDHFVKLDHTNSNWLINQCKISNCGNGIYSLYSPDGKAMNNLRVLHTTFENIGGKEHPHQDAHCIGIQGGTGHIILGCKMRNSGTAIEFYGRKDERMASITIRFNDIANVHRMSNTGGHGICISGSHDATQPVVGARERIFVENNIIADVDGNGVRADSMRDHFSCHTNNISRFGLAGEYKEPIHVRNPFGPTDLSGITNNVVNGKPWKP